MNEKHEVKLRLRAIELLAYWEGRLVTNRLMAWFGISRQQASSDIKRYVTDYNPGALVHDPSVKAYVPKAGFHPVLTTGQLHEYLEVLRGLAPDPILISFEPKEHLSEIPILDQIAKPEIVRAILQACRTRTSLTIGYATMNNPSMQEIVISPHTLLHTGFRWMVRAYCHRQGDFRDFVLSRIDRTPKPSVEPSPLATHDTLWHETIELTLVPNPKLTTAQVALVEKDFGMPDGRLHLSVKKALAPYTMQRYQVGITPDEAADALKFPVILKESDRTRLAPYLFDSHG